MSNSKVCSIDGCGKPIQGPKHGLCAMHWKREKRHGDPLGGTTKYHAEARDLVEAILLYEGEECIFWPYSRDKNGYARFAIKGKRISVSRFVCAIVNGPAPAGQNDTAHSCGKGHLACVTRNHLRWASRKENMADAIIHGTTTQGEKSQFAKLTNKSVLEIRRIGSSMTQREIADIFGVARSQIGRVLNRQRWTHI